MAGSSIDTSVTSSEVNEATTATNTVKVASSPLGQVQGFYYEHNPNIPKLKGTSFEEFDTYWKDYKNYLNYI